jgi:hypothetical protein
VLADQVKSLDWRARRHPQRPRQPDRIGGSARQADRAGWVTGIEPMLVHQINTEMKAARAERRQLTGGSLPNAEANHQRPAAGN